MYWREHCSLQSRWNAMHWEFGLNHKASCLFCVKRATTDLPVSLASHTAGTRVALEVQQFTRRLGACPSWYSTRSHADGEAGNLRRWAPSTCGALSSGAPPNQDKLIMDCNAILFYP